MEQDPIIENESDKAKQIESGADLETKGAEMLESPADGDFVAGLRAFIAWVQSLVAKKD